MMPAEPGGDPCGRAVDPIVDATLSGDENVELPELDDPPDDPLALLRAWLDGAVERGVREPGAMVLATVDGDGHPASRTVLLKSLDGRGLLFTTDAGSAKGRHLAAVPWASTTFYWRETLQQVNLAGPVERVTEAEADTLFAERPTSAQIATAVSRQSEPLDDEQALYARALELRDRGAPVQRPAEWWGYRIVPEWVEFWHGRADRLHRRLVYSRDAPGWVPRRLQP